jgi:hypothetical protein
VKKSRKQTVIHNDGDPWSPVDQPTTSLESVKPKEPQEVKSGNVTAHIDLGAEVPKEEGPLLEGEPLDKSKAEHEQVQEDAKTASEVEEAESALAEKLAALDAAKTGRKTKK